MMVWPLVVKSCAAICTLVRSGGCLAPQSALRHAIIPTLRQQGMDMEETQRGTPYWTRARLLKRVFALELGMCPFCQRGVLRHIAVITQGAVIGNPPPSETLCRPPHRACPCPPSTL
jgi:hypothetical protein